MKTILAIAVIICILGITSAKPTKMGVKNEVFRYIVSQLLQEAVEKAERAQYDDIPPVKNDGAGAQFWPFVEKAERAQYDDAPPVMNDGAGAQFWPFVEKAEHAQYDDIPPVKNDGAGAQFFWPFGK